MEENNQENQEKKDTIFRPTTSQGSFQSNNQEKKNKVGFGKTVVLPFLCGVLGAGVVVGGCFGIPSVKNTLFPNTSTISTEKDDSLSISSDVNTQMISLSEYSNTSVGVAAKVKPSIVGISVEYSVNSIFNRTSSTAKAEGSGVIISQDGYILTNNHVVNSSSSSSSIYYEIGKANKVTVKLYNDDKEYEAKIIGTDEQTDLAVIKIDKDNLTAAELGNSDNVKVGEFCMAIGNALGLGDSVTSGIVSAVNRKVTDSDNNTYNAIQTDAAINSGNSGGALVNSQGQVIGINTLKVSGTGIEGVGFAIPINSTIDIYNQLIQYNKVKRPYIGIGGVDLDKETADRIGAVIGIYVRTIDEFSAAEKAGFKIGDVITKFDGKEVKTMNELNAEKNKKAIGDTVTITVYRDGKTKDLSVKLQEEES